MRAQVVHDSYVSLKGVERDFEPRRRACPKRSRLLQPAGTESPPGDKRRLGEKFGATESNPHALTLSDTLAVLDSLCLLQYRLNEKTVTNALFSLLGRNSANTGEFATPSHSE